MNPIQVTFHFESAALAAAFLAALPEGAPAAEVAAPAKAAKAPKAAPKAATPSVSIEQLKEKLTKVIREKGRDTATKLLQGVGAEKLSEVDTAKYAELDAAADQALKVEDNSDIV